MKRLLAMFCVIVLLFSLSACGNTSQVEKDSDSVSSQDTTATDDSTTETETEGKETESNISDSGNSEPSANSPEENTSPKVTPPQHTGSQVGTEKAPDTEKPAVRPPVQAETPVPETKPFAPPETTPEPKPSVPQDTRPQTPPETKPEVVPEPPTTEEEEKVNTIRLFIGEKELSVKWEDNESVNALKELVKEHPLTIQMSMYGGFEQVGALCPRLPRNDVQTTTSVGDIVLYSGNQIVIFYGSNSWAYTRLGKVSNMSAEDMAGLLGNGDIVITLSN